MQAAKQAKVTRGNGLLEALLARWRADQANRLIPAGLRSGRILDIGCGSSPYFLSHTEFKEKFSIDQQAPGGDFPGISWHVLDLNVEPRLPFSDGYFNIVTLLAVVEHLDPGMLQQLNREIYRVLAPGGCLIITTPASWSDGLLHFMARVGLVSKEEIEEHVYAYTLPMLGWYFGAAGFAMDKIRFGYFEWGLNLWAIASR